MYKFFISLNRSIFMSAYAQVAVWPSAQPGSQIYFHFLGEMLRYSVDIDDATVHTNTTSTQTTHQTTTTKNNPGSIQSLSSRGLYGLSSTWSGINIISLLGPLGLVPHLFTLWELLITGQDIVVLASSPSQASDVVLALGDKYYLISERILLYLCFIAMSYIDFCYRLFYVISF